jgi:hypothetical protein
VLRVLTPGKSGRLYPLLLQFGGDRADVQSILHFHPEPPMNVTSTSSSTYVEPSPMIQTGSGATPPACNDQGGEGGRVHHGHRGGGLGHALEQALQSLGLSAPASSAGSSSASSSSAAGDDGDGHGDNAGASNIKADMRQFMHALFQAVKGEGGATAGAAAGSTSAGDQKTDFASGLSALVAQVSNGSAPSDLQSAFNALAADLQPGGGVSGAAASGAGAASLTLQSLLTKMQSNLGYGPASASATTGNLVSTNA